MSTTVTVSRTIKAPLDEVWAVLGDFGGLAAWHPLVPNSHLAEDGVSRIIKIPGMDVVEVLDLAESTDRSQTYTVERSVMPMTNYRATISIREAPEGCVVEYQSRFDPKLGVPASVTRKMLERFFKTGFAALAKKFES